MENVYRLEKKKNSGRKPRNRSISYDASGRDCFTEYFRVYCLGGKAVRIMQYEPKMNLTYVTLLMDLQ
jgi:hypothetical protein